MQLGGLIIWKDEASGRCNWEDGESGRCNWEDGACGRCNWDEDGASGRMNNRTINQSQADGQHVVKASRKSRRDFIGKIMQTSPGINDTEWSRVVKENSGKLPLKFTRSETTI